MVFHERKPGGLPARGVRFETTHWSLVASAGRERSPEASRALATLCGNYWFPLYAFVRQAGYSAEDAQDLTPERLHQKRWALALLEFVFRRLREQFLAAGKLHLFDRLKPFLAGKTAGRR